VKTRKIAVRKKKAVKKVKKAKKTARKSVARTPGRTPFKKAAGWRAARSSRPIGNRSRAPAPKRWQVNPSAADVLRCVRDVMDRTRPGWDANGSGMSRVVMRDFGFTTSSMVFMLREILSALRASSSYSFFVTSELVQACLQGTVLNMTTAIFAAVQSSPTSGQGTLREAHTPSDAPSRPVRKRTAKASTGRSRGRRPVLGWDLGPNRSTPTAVARSTRRPRPAPGRTRLGVAISEEPPRRKPRYANAVVLDSETDEVLTTIDPGQTVRLRLDIGPRSSESQVQGAEPLPLPDVSTEVDVDVMVSSTDFGVALGTSPLEGAKWSRVAQARFRLPRDGGPAVAPDGGGYLNFYLLAPKKLKRSAHGRINYYYKNVLLQSQKLTLSSEVPPRLGIVTDYTASDDFSGLETVPKRPRFSILTNDNGDDRHQIVIRHPGGTADPPPAGTFSLNGDALRLTIKKLRRTLTDRAPTDKLRPARAFIDDLKALAPIGWELYTQLPGQVSPDFYADLQTSPETFVVQVGRPETSSFVLPWAYMYEIPLITDATPTLCPMVQNWDGKQPLFTGDLRQCPCGPHERDVLCPFGFWGYRYAIEQLSSSDKPVLSIPAAPKCDVVVGETQYGVDLRKLDAHVGRLRTSLAAMPVNAQLREGKDKASLETLLGADLPFIYFYCHGERVNIADPNTYLGVGKGEKITAQDLIGWTKTWYTRLKKLIWNAVRPLVFINACHSLAIEPETLVSYLQAFVSRGRAAGVIGTEVRVDQFLAMDVAEQFVAAWMSGEKTVEETLRAVRLDYLRQGNMLGLVYTPYCWSELRIVGP
jgi:hypothetical protein